MEQHQQKVNQAISALDTARDGLVLIVGHTIAYEYVTDPEKIAFIEEKDPTTQGYLRKENDTIHFHIEYLLGDECDALLEKTVSETEARDICSFILSQGGYIQDYDTAKYIV